jgi:NAD-dependent deacetylase sirtuin 2
MSADDMNNADLVLIMGTSLSVEPFASLVQKVPHAVPRLLLNRHVPYVMQRRPWELLTPSAFSKRRPLRKDASILGECDDSALQVMHGLGWGSLPPGPGIRCPSRKSITLAEDEDYI